MQPVRASTVKRKVSVGLVSGLVLEKVMQFKLITLMGVVLCFCLFMGFITSKPDKFAYEQKVTITDGFFRGQTATIKDRHFFWKYTVDINPGRFASDLEKVREWDLSGVDNEEI